jgi:hypothetical protein
VMQWPSKSPQICPRRADKKTEGANELTWV